MVACAVFGCKSNNNKKLKRNAVNSELSKVNFFRFPKSEYGRIWVAKCGRKDNFNVKYSFICSKHFTPEQYVRNLKHELLQYSPKNSKKLKSDAIPCQNLPGDHNEHTTPVSQIQRRERHRKRNIKSLITSLCENTTRESSSENNTFAICRPDSNDSAKYFEEQSALSNDLIGISNTENLTQLSPSNESHIDVDFLIKENKRLASKCAQLEEENRARKYKFAEDSSDLNSGKTKSIICCICGRLSPGTNVFRFPNDPNLLQDWLKFCEMARDDFRPNTDKICIKHFKATDFLERTNNSQRLRLKMGVTPSCNKPIEESTFILPFEVKFLSEGNEETENQICSNHVLPTSASSHKQINPTVVSASCVNDVSQKKEIGAYDDNSLPTLSIGNQKRSFPRYLNDIKIEQCISEEERLILSIAKRELASLRLRIDTLVHENCRLKAENVYLKGTITELRNKN